MNSSTQNQTPVAPLSQPLLGVISDTHGDAAATSRAVDEFLRRGVERIVHCGDVGTPKILEVFRPIPTDFVAGNCDGPWRTAFETEIPKIGGRFFGKNGQLDWNGRKIFFTHDGNIENRVENEAFSELWDLICCGHTHKFQLLKYKATKILNPGAIQARFEQPCCCVVDANLDVARIFIPETPFADLF